MSKEDRFLTVVFLIAIFLAVLGVWFDAYQANAQDEVAPMVCRMPDTATQFLFHIPAAWNDPTLPSWWALGDGYSMVNDTTIQVDALTHVEIYGEGFPEWEQSLKIGQALVGSGDYATILIADDQTAVCDAQNDVQATNTPQPTQNAANGQVDRIWTIPNAVVSTGRTCVVKYPEIVVVCNG